MSDSNMKYRPDIDGLRAVAVWAVLIFHAFPTHFHGGFVGVDIFFVISGYLISKIIFESMKDGSFSFKDFYSRRIRRIFPALILVMSITLIIGWVVLVADEINQLGLHVAAGAGFVSNLILWSEAGYFDTASELKPLLHLWSLGIEEQFYIFWPILLWAGLRVKMSFWVIAVLFAAISFIFNVAMISSDPTATFYSPVTRSWELLCGAILAWYSFKFPTAEADRSQWQAHALSLSGAALLLASILFMDKILAFPGWWALLPVLGTMCVIAAGTGGIINKHLLSSRVLIWFGLISFPLYLWHWPLLSFGQIIDGEQPKVGYRISALLLSVLLAWLTVRLVERPLRHGHVGNGIKVGALCTFMGLLGIVGLWISKADLRASHTFETRAVERERWIIGGSNKWYHGKENWLFLGNAYDRGVAKLTGTQLPEPESVASLKATFMAIMEAASRYDINVSLLIGPNKSSIYPEYLPDHIEQSEVRYITAFIEALNEVPALLVYDPTSAMQKAKAKEGLLYFKTDTHWNAKGAFVAYDALQSHLGLPSPHISFESAAPTEGDLIGISAMSNHPLSEGDAWTPIHKNLTQPTFTINSEEPQSSFQNAGTSINTQPLIDETIWVVGDSFTSALREYLDATYREVVYLGHWIHKLDVLPNLIEKEETKPDRILIIRVERSF